MTVLNILISIISKWGGGEIGIQVKTKNYTRTQFKQHNTYVHDCYLHDNRGESIYIGSSHYSNGIDPLLEGGAVYNNIIENIGYDGIQVGSAITDFYIYNNTLRNIGTSDKDVGASNTKNSNRCEPGHTCSCRKQHY